MTTRQTMTRRSPRLATKLMIAQAVVVSVGAFTLVVAAALVAPSLFHEHLMQGGVQDPEVNMHAEEAFASSLGIAAAIAAVASLIAAGLVSWFIVRRVARPVEELAQSAEAVAAGHYEVTVPSVTFSAEFVQLSGSFAHMSQRLAETETTRTRLFADLAHELRTPLATLEAYIDGMEDEVLAHDAASWATMRDQVDRLRRLATDLREVAAAEEHALGLTLSRLDGRGVAEAALSAVMPRFQAKGVALSLVACPEPAWILGDDIRLQQVLANLLDNALRHTPPGGVVDVAALVAGECFEIRVRDSGEGIPADQLTSVFERFHRVDPSRMSGDGGGSGLGLTIARAIVSDHRGSLTAASNGTGRGALLTVSIPTV